MRVHRFSVLAALALAASAPQAAVLTVGPGSDCNTSSLATAITLADGLSGPDEIRIASTAVLTAQHLAISNQSLALSGGWSDCAANAIQVGRSTIVGDGRASVLSVRETTGSSYTLSLDRINLSGGGGGDDGVGGGIDLYGRWSVTVRRMEIHDNSTEFDGGGLMIEGPGTLSPASIDIGEDVDIRGNTARNGLGGGIAGKRALIKLRADRVVIRNNSAYRGGGIGADSSNVYVGAYGDEIPYTTATGLIVEQNRANDGGGIALLGSGWLFDAQELTVRNNHANRYGGGIYAVGGQLQLQRDYPNYWRVQCTAGQFCSRIEANVAGNNCPSEGAGSGQGGGLYLDKVSAYVSQTLLSDNCAYGNPAFFSWGPSTRFESSVITRNLMRDRSDQYDQTGNTIVGLGSRVNDPAQFTSFRGVSLLDNRARTTAGTLVPAQHFSGASNASVQMIAVAYDQLLGSSGTTSACMVGGVDAAGYRDVASNDFRPRPGSALIDVCPDSTFAANYAGLDLQPRCVDDPTQQRGGACDVGAAEAPLDNFFAGFASGFE
ncbi:MAG: right-handed parallel beta-helix repeat-containing protein [Xanthomonadales bacterium]|nr:right-handed parallel beta-helix repeat-containing protein [Xanthomonadales bacterium]